MADPKEKWDWLGFLSNWHEKEYERRYTLEGVVVTPISLLTGIYGIVYLVVTQYDFKHSSPACLWLFLGLLAVSLGLSFWSAYHVFMSYAVLKNGTYHNIPKADLLRNHMAELVTHYKQHEPQVDGEVRFREYIVELLAAQISVNVENNDARTVSIQRSKKPLMAALLALFLSLPFFIVNRLAAPDPVYNVALPFAPPALSKPSLSLPITPQETQTLSPTKSTHLKATR